MGEKHVLLVGPDPAGGRTTRDLTSKGYAVTAVADAQEAVRFIERTRPLVVFVNLPSRDAVEKVTRAFRQGRHNLPMVLICPDQDARQWAEKLGLSAFASHPARLEGGICENLAACRESRIVQ